MKSIELFLFAKWGYSEAVDAEGVSVIRLIFPIWFVDRLLHIWTKLDSESGVIYFPAI